MIYRTRYQCYLVSKSTDPYSSWLYQQREQWRISMGLTENRECDIRKSVCDAGHCSGHDDREMSFSHWLNERART